MQPGLGIWTMSSWSFTLLLCVSAPSSMRLHTSLFRFTGKCGRQKAVPRRLPDTWSGTGLAVWRAQPLPPVVPACVPLPSPVFFSQHRGQVHNASRTTQGWRD